MVQVVLPCGLINHTPPYTDEEVADLFRQGSGIMAFTLPGAKREGAEETSGNLGIGDDPGPGGIPAPTACPHEGQGGADGAFKLEPIRLIVQDDLA